MMYPRNIEKVSFDLGMFQNVSADNVKTWDGRLRGAWLAVPQDAVRHEPHQLGVKHLTMFLIYRFGSGFPAPV